MARLGQGIRKRTDGNLEKRITLNGKRISIYGKTSKEIQEKELEIRNNYKCGLIDNSKITLSQYYEEFKNNKRQTIKSNSLRLYNSVFEKNIPEYLKKKQIRKIEKREFVVVLQELANNKSIYSSNMTLRILKIIFNSAETDEVIIKNPIKNIKAIPEAKKGTDSSTHRALTEEEQKIFFEELKNQNSFYYEFIALLINSGLRCGELAALSWKDIDLKKNVIRINKTTTCTEEAKIIIGDSPKSESGFREIPINENIMMILKAQKEKSNIISLENENVFLTVYGKIISDLAINKEISRILKILEEKGRHIDKFTAHALRHTFATRFIEQGGNPKTLQVIMGHSSLAMTMDLYTHVLPNTKQKEMDNLKIVI